MVSLKGGQQTSSASSLGRAALPLIVSDTALQGARYAFILYLGAQSLSELGSFLIGGAVGSLLGVAADFGISQHWLRLGAKNAHLTCRTFTRAIRGKIICSLLGLLLLVSLAFGGIWKIATPLAMAIGLFLMVLQALVDSCEAVGLLFHRYATVALFRILISLGMYAMPLICGVLLGQDNHVNGISVALITAAGAGLVLSSLYIRKVTNALPGEDNEGMGYKQAWWDARLLGLNQLAVVMDVRAPLIILGVMLGEAAVGLYGLVQRTTAMVELAWASISRLLLTSYAELIGVNGVRKMRTQVIHAGKVTALIMTVAAICVWGSARLITRLAELSAETAIAFSLLQWAVIAIGFSSIKRPFVSALIALYQERAVCRVNLCMAVGGLILVPLLIMYFGIWGPVLGWVILEAIACILILHLFLAMPLTDEAKPDPSLVQRISL